MEDLVKHLKTIIIDLCDEDCPQSYKDVVKEEISKLEL
jgi:hypothetical protein